MFVVIFLRRIPFFVHQNSCVCFLRPEAGQPRARRDAQRVSLDWRPFHTLPKGMPMRTSAAVIIALAGSLLLAGPARADRRIFAFTYPYMTLPGGSFELEHYLDLGLQGWDDPATATVEHDWSRPAWQHQVEFEYGITDRLDFGFYNVFKQDPFEAFKFDGIKLRSRYRFADPGVHFVDAATYLEFSYFGDEIEIEQKLILSKILGRVELAFNATIEESLESSTKAWTYLLTPSLGLGYHLSPGVAVTLEYVGRMLLAEGKVAYYVSYLGPGISVAGGPFYWTLAAEPQLGRRTSLAAVQVRSLLGIVF